ncbi:DUF2252 domain-containing protein [Branchiibius cervicis]|uniref:DUF2252 domain-containing protein n=1 Tax=Branchiibius cervicis TaxID=908252 RepID=A0ABW2AR72_9MICO
MQMIRKWLSEGMATWDTPPDRRTERAAFGKSYRREVPLGAHAEVPPLADRADPVDLLEQQAQDRVASLVPIRYGRMLVSPFTFYRGAALIMATDLAAVPRTALTAQLCGDAHVSNFGLFASTERRLVFDLNDFDETLPGPFEWDVKRLAASVELAGRDNGVKDKARRKIVRECVRNYRRTMRSFAKDGTLNVWYARLDVDDLLASGKGLDTKRARRTATEQADKARARDRTQALRKFTTVQDGQVRIVHDPPLVVPIAELPEVTDPQAVLDELNDQLRAYLQTLTPERRRVMSQFHAIDAAHKVVGVGSVGTRAWIVLMEGAARDDAFLLQVKQAQSSVLETVLGPAAQEEHGERVVVGQRLMQVAGDPFLGWKRMQVIIGQESSVDYYLRQLRDWKGSMPIDQLTPRGLGTYARACAWTLARAHARTGDRFAIAGYLGKSEEFDHSVADFAAAYADLNDADYRALEDAVQSGRVRAQTGV